MKWFIKKFYGMIRSRLVREMGKTQDAYQAAYADGRFRDADLLWKNWEYAEKQLKVVDAAMEHYTEKTAK